MGPSHLPSLVDVAARMRLAASAAHMVIRGGTSVAAISGCGRWVPLQHVQHPIYFRNI
jgi:hypothetical protein